MIHSFEKDMKTGLLVQNSLELQQTAVETDKGLVLGSRFPSIQKDLRDGVGTHTFYMIQ